MIISKEKAIRIHKDTDKGNVSPNRSNALGKRATTENMLNKISEPFVCGEVKGNEEQKMASSREKKKSGTTKDMIGEEIEKKMETTNQRI